MGIVAEVGGKELKEPEFGTPPKGEDEVLLLTGLEPNGDEEDWLLLGFDPNGDD